MRKGEQDGREHREWLREDGRSSGRIPAAAAERHATSGEAGGRLWSTDAHAARIRRTVQREWRRLGFRRQFVMLLVAATLLSTLGTVIAAYIGARATALDSAQARVTREVRVAGAVLATHGPNITVRDGQLYADDGYRLNGDTQFAGQVRDMTGDGIAVYQVEGQQLVGVAGDLGDGATAVMGDTLTGPAFTALFGGCPTNGSATVTCQHRYQGVVTLHGTAYVAAFAPLPSAQGAPVGALVVATPLAAIEAPLRVLAGVLLLIGLALASGFIVAGYRLAGPVSRRAFTALRDGLDDVGGGAGQVSRLAHTMSTQSTRQLTTARQLLDEARTLNEAAQALGHGVSVLRDATGQLWAEMSYPGAQPTAASSRTARQVAVAASQIGGAADQATAVCQSLRARMNQIIAEAGVLADGGREAEQHARELGAALQRIEAAIGRRGTLPNNGLSRVSLPTPPDAARGTNRLPAFPAAGGETGPARTPGGLGSGDSTFRPGRRPRWNGDDPTTGHLPHAPRAGQPERSGLHPGLGGSAGHFRPVQRPNTPGPRAPGSHPGASGSFDPFGSFGAPRLPDGGGQPGAPGLRDPEAGDHAPPRGGSPSNPRPRPDDWMNDLR